tara:strand:+ start:4099 stop:4434 length:336 start_codon:yes stop_codon:yes gene_type:complete
MPKKLTPTDERYLAWKKEQDNKVSRSISDDETKGETKTIKKGQACIIIKKPNEMEIAICPENEKQLKEVELIAVGLYMCLQKKSWTDALIKRTHKFLSEKLNPNNNDKGGQ